MTIESADSSLVDALHPSENINERRNGLTPQLLILHYTGLPSVERSILTPCRARICDCR